MFSKIIEFRKNVIVRDFLFALFREPIRIGTKKKMYSSFFFLFSSRQLSVHNNRYASNFALVKI